MSLNVDLPDPPTLASVDPNEYDDPDIVEVSEECINVLQEYI